MFNRTLFNRTFYNRINFVFTWTGSAEALTEESSAFKVAFDFSGQTEATTEDSSAFVVLRSMSGQTEAIAEINAHYVRVRFMSGEAEALSESSQEDLDLYDLDTLTFENIGMTVGQVLTINTDTMTATLDGTVVNNYLDDDSVFFLLKVGDNTITVTGDDGSDTATIKIDHRERWL